MGKLKRGVRGQAKSRNSHSVCEEGAEGREERDGRRGWSKGGYILSGFICQGKSWGFEDLLGTYQKAFKQNDMICLEEHFSSDMETKPSSSGAPAIV